MSNILSANLSMWYTMQSRGGGQWTIGCGGADIGGTSDSFHFVYLTIPGDFMIWTQVLTQSNSSAYAKAGLMVREDTSVDSQNVAVMSTQYDAPINFQSQARLTKGATTSNPGTTNNALPYWIALLRYGTSVGVYTSPNGYAWTQMSSSPFTVVMPDPVLAGLAICSHNSGVNGTATTGPIHVKMFNSKTLMGGWNAVDIGAPSPAGTDDVYGYRAHSSCADDYYTGFGGFMSCSI